MSEPTDAKPVAWLVPKLHTFKGAERVHFTRAPGCTMTDAELTEYMEGRVMWLPTTFCDSDAGVTDKFGVVHKPKPLYTTPQPTKAQAVAITPPPIECNTEELKRAYAFGWWSALEKQRETAQAGAVPLTPEAINAMAREYPAEDLCGWSYRMGVADAGALHGIKGEHQ